MAVDRAVVTLGPCGWPAGCALGAVAYVDTWSRMGRVSIVTGPGALVLATHDPLPVYCEGHVRELVAEALGRATIPG